VDPALTTSLERCANAFITPSSFEIHLESGQLHCGRKTSNRDDPHTRRSSATPFYSSLDESQKHKFGMLGRMLMPERSKFAMDMMHQHMGEPDRDGAE
jgi:hypothetical protein